MPIRSIPLSIPDSFSGWGDGDLPDPSEMDFIPENVVLPDRDRKYPVRDFLRLTFPDYCLHHQVPEFKLKTVRSMMKCKTGDLGYTLIRCPECGRIEMHACSCGSRNCPSCGYLEEKRWTAMRQAEIIPGIPYFHLVFTLPHSLSGIMYQNQKQTLNLLFRSVQETILKLSRKKLKMIPGILMILHSFGSDLSLHYHLHVLVSGGGLTKDKKEFKRCLSQKFFLPLKAVEKVYKGKFMSGLKKLHDTEKLQYFHEMEKYRNFYEWKELLNTCYNACWNVEIKPLAPAKSGDHAETTENVVSYFARYTNRTAVSNSRIISFDREKIRFRYKAYHGTAYTMKVMELSSDEFIRRFLMHLLPVNFSRIRTAGFLACCVRDKNLKLIGAFLDKPYKSSPVKRMSGNDLLRHFYGRDVSICICCHAKVEILPRLKKKDAIRYVRGMP